jgi:hypothetical protein
VILLLELNPPPDAGLSSDTTTADASSPNGVHTPPIPDGFG